MEAKSSDVDGGARRLARFNWMIDNVRRGSELVQGQGETAPNMTFATLYRLRKWSDGRWQPAPRRGQVFHSRDDLRQLFA